MKSTLVRLYKELLLRGSKRGSYKFLVEKVANSMDLDLAASIFQSDYYRGTLRPLEVDIENVEKVLVLAPHQDDEIIGCGGILSVLRSKNKEIHICYLTDGASGDNNPELIQTRKKEAQNVCNYLNAAMYELDVNNVDLNISDSQKNKLKKILGDKFDLIFLPWILDSPPKHRLCNALIAKCLKELNWKNQELMCYQVHTHLIPNAYFDYSAFFKEKERLFDFYPSQMKVQNYKHISRGLDAWSSRFLGWSENERFVELYTRFPAKEFLKLFSLYESDLDQTFKSDTRCIASYKKLFTQST